MPRRLALRLVAAGSDIAALDAISLVPALAGVVLLAGGASLLRWSWPAIAFLAFMLPLPFTIEAALAHPLRRVATVASTYVLQTIGCPAFAEGNVILIEDCRLGVAEACSGLGMLLTFFALSTAFALVVQRPLVDRLVLVASAVPVAVAANVVRISATGVAYYAGGAAERGRPRHHARPGRLADDAAGAGHVMVGAADVGSAVCRAGGAAAVAAARAGEPSPVKGRVTVTAVTRYPAPYGARLARRSSFVYGATAMDPQQSNHALALPPAPADGALSSAVNGFRVLPPASDAGAGPPGLSAAPTLPALLLALRRRWLLAVGLGLVAAALAVTAVFLWLPPRYVVESRFIVMAAPDSVLFGSNSDPHAEFAVFKEYEKALIHSRLVLAAALNEKATNGREIRDLPMVRAHGNSVIDWMDKALKADFKMAPEIMSAWLSGDDPDELAEVLNAISSAFVKENDEKEKVRRKERVDLYRENLKVKEQELSSLRGKLNAKFQPEEAQEARQGDPARPGPAGHGRLQGAHPEPDDAAERERAGVCRLAGQAQEHRNAAGARRPGRRVPPQRSVHAGAEEAHRGD